jgi:hypothetical protein
MQNAIATTGPAKAVAYFAKWRRFYEAEAALPANEKLNLLTFNGLPEEWANALAEGVGGKLYVYQAEYGEISPATIFFRMSKRAAREWFRDRCAYCRKHGGGFDGEPDALL